MTEPAPPPIELSREERRRRRRETWIIVAAALAVAVFAFWEVRNPEGRGASGNVFSFLLVNMNIVLLLVLVYLVLRNVLKLVLERRQRVPGSQLKMRLVTAFVTISLVPATVMLFVSYEFVTNSIDDWLSDEVEQSLEGAWQLARTYYNESADGAVAHAGALAGEIEREGLFADKQRLRATVERYQKQYGLGTVQVVGRDGAQRLAAFNEQTPTGMPMFHDPELLARNLAGETATKVESLGEGDVIRGSAPIHGGGASAATGEPGPVIGAVVVDYFVSHSARRWSEEILTSFRDFRQLRLSKQPFKNLYALTLGLASVVVVFSATWLGLYLARGITDPIGNLAAATREVAGGRWDVRLPVTGGDEVGTLVRGFNAMTGQLERTRDDLDERRAYIENVLANIEAGVLSVDADLVVGTVNPAAVSLLGLPEGGLSGRAATDVLAEAGYAEIGALLVDLAAGRVASGTRINVSRKEAGRTVQVTATNLRREGGERAGSVLFFENVSQILAVQRMEAWREVARRIAHEIKNPLTPIQLSAQRLGRRLGARVDAEDATVVEECVGTIVSEVDRLKRLVNEFSQFAGRSEEPKVVHELNRLVDETVPLYRESRPDIELLIETAPGLPPVAMHRDAVKRVLVNLLDNAVAAVSDDGGPHPQIFVRTHFDADLSRVVLEVGDSGPGIPAADRARVFEPYFSTKAEGTGLGLAMVASVAADHQAFVRLHDNEPRGSRFVLEFPMANAVETA